MTPPPHVGSSRRHLAVVELLDDGFALLADVADADELGLAVALEEPAAYPLDHDGGGASARHAAVLDVPEDAHRRNVFRAIVLWGAWGTHGTFTSDDHGSLSSSEGTRTLSVLMKPRVF